jgi:hypothetical protein
MTTWTAEELQAFDAAHEIGIATRRRDGTLRRPVTIWLVRVGDDLYVRSVNGPEAGWYRGTRTRHEGHIQAGDVERDVEFIDTEDAPDHDIDRAYAAKYRYSPSAVSHINSPKARPTTLKLVPRT